MPKYQIEFSDVAPDTVQVMPTDSLDVHGLEVPGDAMQFTPYDADWNWIGPHFFVTNEIVVDGLDELKSRYPEAMILGADLGAQHGATSYGWVSWDHPAGKERSGSLIVPLIEGISAIYDRKNRKVAWPPAL